MVGSVSAASESDDLQMTNDTDTVSTGEDAVISVSDSGEVLGDAGTFTQLQNLIDANYGGTITLQNDYSYATDEYILGVNITKKITINGNGKTIDCKDVSRAFWITGSNVVLKNLTFINGYAEGYGTSIRWEGDYGLLEDCTFKDSLCWRDGSFYGGAVYLKGSYGIINHCHFENIVANYTGGSIDGGALSVHGLYDNITNCIFINNTAKGAGGAIHLQGHYCNVSECDFYNNTAETEGGGAILFWETDNYIYGCYFEGNRALNSWGGGAVSARYTNCIIEECTFRNNTGTTGGAVEVSTQGTIIKGCEFYDSTATTNGGAIAVKANGVNISDCSFENNSATTGGAISVTGDASTLTDLDFNNNHDENGGGALYIESGKSTFLEDLTYETSSDKANITNVTLLENRDFYIAPVAKGKKDGSSAANAANWTYAYDHIIAGGTIYFSAGTYTEIINMTISKTLNLIGLGVITIDLQQKGRAFYITAVNTIINNIDMKNGNYSTNGGTIYWNANNGTLISSSITYSSTYTANKHGGAIYWTGNYGNVEDCDFNNNVATGVGGAIYWTGSYGNVCGDSSFNLNNASDRGGAIFWSGNYGNIENSSFDGNIAAGNGGAIFVSGTSNIINHCNFTNNQAVNGSAIYLYQNKVLDIQNCVFQNNVATDKGTVYLENNTQVSFEGSSFGPNTGGAIYTKEVMNPNVVYVSKTGTGSGLMESDPTSWSTGYEKVAAGGKIILLNYEFTTIVAQTISKSVAIVGSGSTVLNGGGTKRFFIIDAADVTIENITFTNGNGDNGGAISWSGDNGQLINCTFTNNIATGNGGAVYWTGFNGAIDKTIFETTTSKNPLYTTQSVTVTNSVLQNQFSLSKTGNINYGVDEVISGTFSSNAPTSVTIYLNGESKGTASVSSNSFSKTFSLLPVGSYTISIKDNNNNNYTFTSSTSFTVSRIATVYISPGGGGSGASSSSPTTWDNVADIITSTGTIVFANGNYDLYGKSISNAWTLTASSASNVIINGNGQTTIFSIDTTGVKIYNLTLINASKPITDSNVVTVKDSVLENQIKYNIGKSSYVYGETITITGSLNKISPSAVTAYGGNTLIETSTGSAASYSISRNGDFAVGSYTLTLSKTDFKEV